MDHEIADLLTFIGENQQEMVAVGEIGLPYYLRRKNSSLSHDAYVELLEDFIKKATDLHKPIILHAVYGDAPIVCDLLEKYSVTKAHFHWFKGDVKTIGRMIQNGYFISVTPDILYETEIQDLIRGYPLSHVMVETDGPWPFEGKFKGEMTHPNMIHQSIRKIAELKCTSIEDVYNQLYSNTKDFYEL